MKFRKLLSAASLVAVGAVAFAPAALAAETDNQTSEGKFTITAGTDPDFEGFIKPGTYQDKIGMDEAYGHNGSKSATLRFNWVPNFDFGTIAATTTDTIVNSKIHAYKYDDSALGSGGNIYQFMQVQDMTGNANSQFRVSLSVTNFTSGTGASATTLTNTRMRLLGLSTSNNLQVRPTNPSNNGLLQAPAIEADPGYLTLNPGTAVPILTATAPSTGNVGSNGSVSSVVFNDGYTAATDPTGTENDQVQLFVPSNEMIQGEYTATMTWSLDNTL